MKNLALLPCWLAVSCLLAAAGEKVRLEGRVIDRETKDPLPAYVMAPGGPGITADAAGRFVLNVEKPPSGKVPLVVWLLGYRKRVVEAAPGVFLTVELDLEPLKAAEVTVTADSLVSDEPGRKAVALTKMDIYTLPGTAADPVGAGRLLPGVNAPPDSSSLLIRGGAPEEVCYVFDGIEIRHPFLSESLHESYFSIFDNQVVDKFSVATTGFHPRHGNALSGVMDITAKDHPARAEGGLGLSVLGLTTYAALPVTSKGSFVGSYDRGFSDVLTALNSRGGGRHFATEHAFGKARWEIGAWNEIRFYGMIDKYKYSQTGDGAFRVRTRNSLGAVTWTSTPARNVLLTGLVAALDYDVAFDEPDTVRVKSRDGEVQSRLEGRWDVGGHALEFGGDLARRRLSSRVESGAAYDDRTRATRLGFFAHDKFRLTGRLYLNAGLRLSRIDLLRSGWTCDPRLSAAWLVGTKGVIRLSAGLYHQFGDESSLRTNPGLKPEAATHLALSYDRLADGLDFRISIYDKEYRRLLLTEPGGAVGNGGLGYARGAEIFVKRDRARYEALLVYNYLHSRRREGDVPVLAPSPYAIDHSATGIFRWKFSQGSLGLRYSYATGRPYTPLLGREWDAGEEAYLPVWGPPLSRRTPAYRRLDLNGSWNFRLFGAAAVAYFGITNLLDSRNILRYEYAPDYGGRIDQESIFGRSLFVGLYLPLF